MEKIEKQKGYQNRMVVVPKYKDRKIPHPKSNSDYALVGEFSMQH
jgi:hypothetical protein